MIIDEEDFISHIGILRRSGRYPWGSGSTENKRNKDFLDYVDDLKKQGLSDKEIVAGLNLNKKEQDRISTTDLRAARTIANNQQQLQKIRRAEQLKEKNLSNIAIGKKMDVNESVVRSLLAPGAKEKAEALLSISKVLEDGVAEHGFIDIGKGVQNHLGISKEKLRAAVAILREKGYKIFYGKIRQPGTGHETSQIALGGPDAEYRGPGGFYERIDSIHLLTAVSKDYGKTFSGDLGMVPPIKINPNRVGVNYAENGGTKADGVIYVRRDVSDLSLGNASYAQVRIAVGNGHYLKGMAMYKDDMPDGVDLLFNTNKSKNDPKILKQGKLGAFKEIGDDPGNPFGAIVSQIRETKADGTLGKATSAMNIVNEEGDWDTWSRNLSSQVLSKQSPALARAQLDMTFERKENQFKEIMALTNPTVRKKLLKEFSDDVDASAVHLKAAALPRQTSRVILPVNSLKPNEIYAPSYTNGEIVALVRYPHGGTFEIPELVVNNKHRESRTLLGEAKDAVGINASVAERLSGADFDGDTVLVIPNNNRVIKSTPALDQLKNFEPRVTYSKYDGMKVISEKHMQKEMGDISNLITDMTIRKASSAELARAVKHSMVVIDSYKHELDYKQSAADNNIKALKAKYQGRADSGATTLISLAGSQARVPDRRARRVAEGGPINPKTGELEYVYTGKGYVNKQGKWVDSSTKSKKLAETRDANTLVGDPATPIEKVYATHSNKLKSLANQARLEMINTPRLERNPSAATIYASEVKRLDGALNTALKNAPLERRALTIAAVNTKARVDANPHMDNTQKRRIEAQALEEARTRVGAKKIKVVIEPNEWEAIQQGAISDTKLKAILDNADLDRVKELATPRTKTLMSGNKTARAKTMLASGFTRSEVAASLGVSLTTLDNAVSGG